MAFNQRMIIEVDAATGNANNGGGFDDTTGVPGTNFAWGANQLATAATDIVCSGAGSTFTSATLSALAGGAAACVGNIINTTAGANLTTGRFQILSQAAGTFTVDRAISTGAVAGGSGTLGGALATIQQGINAAFISAGAVADCRVYVKKGAYTGTVALLTTSSVSSSKYRQRIIGYNASHDDDPTVASGNQPTYAVGSGAGVNGLTVSTTGFSFENLQLDGTQTSGTKGTTGLSVTNQYNRVWNCKISNFSAEGFITNSSGYPVTFGLCEVTACAGTTGSVVLAGPGSGGQCTVIWCWIHKNTKCGILLASATNAISNLVTNNSGASSDGIQCQQASLILGNTIYGAGRDGIRSNGSANDPAIAAVWMDNIIAKSAGFGLNVSVAPALPSRFAQVNFNAYYSNTSGNYQNITAGDNDVAVSVNPFNSSDVNLAAETSPDWGLNNTGSAGASLRAVGFPGQMPGLTTSTGYRDLGLYQHQDSGGGSSGMLYIPSMDGL